MHTVTDWTLVYVTNCQPVFCLTFCLTGLHFRGELQHVGDITEQNFRYGPIRTLEITDIRLYRQYGPCYNTNT